MVPFPARRIFIISFDYFKFLVFHSRWGKFIQQDDWIVVWGKRKSKIKNFRWAWIPFHEPEHCEIYVSYHSSVLTRDKKPEALDLYGLSYILNLPPKQPEGSLQSRSSRNFDDEVIWECLKPSPMIRFSGKARCYYKNGLESITFHCRIFVQRYALWR